MPLEIRRRQRAADDVLEIWVYRRDARILDIVQVLAAARQLSPDLFEL
ncbi:hypothetical protein [Devosia sp.]|nr:hypothetical protein [Devosia sp.]